MRTSVSEMNTTVLRLLAIGMLAAPVTVSATATYYTFTGTVTAVVEQVASWDNQVNPNNFVAVGDSVTYVFALDFDRLGEQTNWNGVTSTINDLGGLYDYFWADFLRNVSSPTLPVPTLEDTNLSSAASLNFGLSFNSGGAGQIGEIWGNSRYNQFHIWSLTSPVVANWVVGTQLYGQSRALIWLGNDTYFDSFSLDLRLSDISSTMPATSSVPEPGTLALLGIGLTGLGLSRRRKAN